MTKRRGWAAVVGLAGVGGLLSALATLAADLPQVAVPLAVAGGVLAAIGGALTVTTVQQREPPELGHPSERAGQLAPDVSVPGSETGQDKTSDRALRDVVWNVPARNRNFTGRKDQIDQVEAVFESSASASVVALHGMGGVGKTQIAIEFAHRHAADFDVAWFVDAEQELLIGQQIAALAPLLHIHTTGQIPADAAAVLRQLRMRQRWLLVFDNAEPSASLRRWIPEGNGRVLITSRSRGWGGMAHPIEVQIFERPEAVSLLGRRIPGIETDLAADIASELGDLPLALEQAAAYLETTGTPPQVYLGRFRGRREFMLAKGADVAYGGTVATAWSLTLERLREQSPATVQLLDLCAHFGPEPIPLAVLARRPDLLDDPLAGIVSDGDSYLDIDDVVGAAVRFSLASRDAAGIRMHVLIQAVIRANQTSEQLQRTAGIVRSLLVAFHPGVPAQVAAGWPAWTQLAPHALTAPAMHPDDPAADVGEEARLLLLDAGWYLHSRGDPYAAKIHIARLYDRWTSALGADHPDTLAAAHRLAVCFWMLGDPAGARTLDEDTLMRRRRVLGPDDPETLRTASNLGIDLRALGELDAAKAIHEDTLARQRQLLGPDHPYSLRTANSLAEDLRMLGDAESARVLHEEILERQTRLYGEDNLETLTTANNLAEDLYALGDYDAARSLREQVLARQRTALGFDHPHTLRTASNLVRDLGELGLTADAQELGEDTLSRQSRVLGDDHPETLRTIECLRAIKNALAP